MTPKFLALPLAGGKGRDKKNCIFITARLKYVPDFEMELSSMYIKRDA